MAGDEGDGMVGVAVGDGNAGIGQAADPRRNARHDAKRHAAPRQRLGFLAAAPKDERIAALQSQHALALPRQIHQQIGNLVLLAALHARALAGIDQSSPLASASSRSSTSAS